MKPGKGALKTDCLAQNDFVEMEVWWLDLQTSAALFPGAPRWRDKMPWLLISSWYQYKGKEVRMEGSDGKIEARGGHS